ncbi:MULTISPECIES: hypothetical protein [unclassified Dietzia]|uniref:hypothetical protein n=1 Tax=unclassified Dietzia TaxID=2617939 RepID=UPI000D20DB59|nr:MULTISPECIES: hypothetical protein [unclassified Dietzia]AVZ40660.1 hypothetical protein CT688_15505 [Dietzia sp. JS16-p6b]MBB1022835.1 hypothetical protein [Dietzia sp. DQ12-76]MBB1026691.1 hypothetical protein [Dietzia sp. DQ11-38-2]QGW26233.1 hypothetical protein GJR88_04911 [Dietzia sp. DQ12-45-1b]
MSSEKSPETPEDLGNTIDGTRVGDGSAPDPATAQDASGIDPDAPGSGGHSDGQSVGPGDGTATTGSRGLEEQKRIYQTPEQPDHALGGSEGTADGM